MTGDLIARLEAASEGNADLDYEIAEVTDTIERPYTTSLDAALTLVPDGMRIMVEGGMGRGAAQVWKPTMSAYFDCKRAKTPAIALCIAALKARAA